MSESSANTKVSEEDAPGTGAAIPLQHMVTNTVKHSVSLQPTELHRRTGMHLQPLEDPKLEQE